MSNVEKTNRDYWDKSWESLNFYKKNNLLKYTPSYQRFNKLFDVFLIKSSLKYLEVGCGKGKWMVYFSKKYNYDVYGIDYSDIGCRMAIENLNNNNVKGNVLCEDLFDNTLEKKSFDVVMSMGVIEHYDLPKKVLEKHVELLKKGGILIVSVPNFNRKSIYYKIINKLFDKNQLEKTHNLKIMEKKYFLERVNDFNLKILFFDYFGPINLLLPIQKELDKKILYFIHFINQIIGLLSFFIKSKKFSPYLLLVAKKE